MSKQLTNDAWQLIALDDGTPWVTNGTNGFCPDAEIARRGAEQTALAELSAALKSAQAEIRQITQQRKRLIEALKEIAERGPLTDYDSVVSLRLRLSCSQSTARDAIKEAAL